MSDAGIYSAQEDELLAALQAPGIAGVVDYRKTLSIEDLISRDGIRKPCIGVIDAGAEAMDGPAIGGKRVRAKVRWEVAAVVQNQRGAVSGRELLRAILEGVRDVLNGLASSNPLKTRYRWKSDQPHTLADADLCAAVATFEIETYFGN